MRLPFRTTLEDTRGRPAANWAIAALAVLALGGCEEREAVSTEGGADRAPLSIVSAPRVIDPACREGRALGGEVHPAILFDECRSQRDILDEAMREARGSGKTVLVFYGSEGVWAVVLDRYVHAGAGTVEYDIAGRRFTSPEETNSELLADARALNAFVSENFVLAYINFVTDDGVLDETGARENFTGMLPLIYALSSSGKFAAALDQDGVRRLSGFGPETFRGYDRKGLLAELRRVRASAQRQ